MELVDQCPGNEVLLVTDSQLFLLVIGGGLVQSTRVQPDPAQNRPSLDPDCSKVSKEITNHSRAPVKQLAETVARVHRQRNNRHVEKYEGEISFSNEAEKVIHLPNQVD